MMKSKTSIPERDREATEKRLIDAVGRIIAEEGFEKIGINAVAARSGLSKILIYRYFDSIEGLMAAYIRQHDFWINFPAEIPDREHLPAYLKELFRRQTEQLRSDPTLRRLFRWELSSKNELITKIREQREQIGLEIIEKISQLTDYSRHEIAAMASIPVAAITYLVMLEEFCPVYNGIPIDHASGWEQINAGIALMIDKIFQPR